MSLEKTPMSASVHAVVMRHGGIFCCSRKYQCTWQGFALHQGLGWGVIPHESNPWRQWHDRKCSGKLIQLVEPADGSNCREGIDQFGQVVKSA